MKPFPTKSKIPTITNLTNSTAPKGAQGIGGLMVQGNLQKKTNDSKLQKNEVSFDQVNLYWKNAKFNLKSEGKSIFIENCSEIAKMAESHLNDLSKLIDPKAGKAEKELPIQELIKDLKKVKTACK